MRNVFRFIQQLLAELRPMRRLGDTLFRLRMRRRAAELDRLSVARCQRRTLLGLAHKARNTRFGLAHDFQRIKTPADFQRLVPLQTPISLWRDYWRAAQGDSGDLADQAGVTWPEPILDLAPASVHNAAGFPHVPITPGLLAAHRIALRTSLALAFQAQSNSVPCPSTAREWLCRVNSRMRPSATGWLVGSTDTIVRATPDAQKNGWHDTQHVIDVWPSLAAAPAKTGTARSRPLHPSLASALKAYLPAEGPIGAEDPRHQCLRLIPDAGVYFELVPVAELGSLYPVRHGVAELETGIPYALALTTPAGLWACLTGARLCFERRDPPLFRLLECTFPVQQPTMEDVSPSPAHPFPSQPPHGRATPRPTKPESWKKAKRLIRRLLSDV
jgi:hypothetical protein